MYPSDDHREIEGTSDERDADPEEDDADVLHAVVRQKALEIVLGEGVQHAGHPGKDSDGDEEGTSRRAPALGRVAVDDDLVAPPPVRDDAAGGVDREQPAGRGLEMKASPIKELALRHHVPIFQPARLRDPP